MKKNKSNTPPPAPQRPWIVLAILTSVTLIVVVTLVVSGPLAVVPVLAASVHAWTKLMKSARTT